MPAIILKNQKVSTIALEFDVFIELSSEDTADLIAISISKDGYEFVTGFSSTIEGAHWGRRGYGAGGETQTIWFDKDSLEASGGFAASVYWQISSDRVGQNISDWTNIVSQLGFIGVHSIDAAPENNDELGALYTSTNISEIYSGPKVLYIDQSDFIYERGEAEISFRNVVMSKTRLEYDVYVEVTDDFLLATDKVLGIRFSEYGSDFVLNALQVDEEFYTNSAGYGRGGYSIAFFSSEITSEAGEIFVARLQWEIDPLRVSQSQEDWTQFFERGEAISIGVSQTSTFKARDVSENRGRISSYSGMKVLPGNSNGVATENGSASLVISDLNFYDGLIKFKINLLLSEDYALASGKILGLRVAEYSYDYQLLAINSESENLVYKAGYGDKGKSLAIYYENLERASSESMEVEFLYVGAAPFSWDSFLSLFGSGENAEISVGVGQVGTRSVRDITLSSSFISADSFGFHQNSAPSGSIAITGALEEKQTLTADTSSLADEDGLGTFNYQWLRDGTAIAGATTSTYTTTELDVDRALSVTVSYTDEYGTVETITSASSGTIANVIPTIISSTHRTSILVDKDVLGASPIILQGLTENIEKTDGVTTSHVFSYNGSDYDYDEISPFIMIVVRDNEFTDDFRSELADFAPEFKDISYQDAVVAVGLVGISDAIITVAGADGNYIG